jgi:squalene-associated FAD-dependent desaturase
MSEDRVLIVGGGLGGLAAAVGLVSRGVPVTILEARPILGGRASSLVDPGSGQQIDNCQHVGMGCCTNLQRFCELTGIDDSFQRERTLYFYGPDGRECVFRPWRWLPAPLHLGPALFSLKYLTLVERMAIGRAMLSIARLKSGSAQRSQTMDVWLTGAGQSKRVQDLFWLPVLVSALSETLDRISVERARQVFVEGFMTHRDAYAVDLPTQPLAVLYDQRVRRWLEDHGGKVVSGTRVKRIARDAAGRWSVTDASGQTQSSAAVILAVPWKHAHALLDDETAQHIAEIQSAQRLESAPISSVHLWFDRACVPRPHAVIVGQELSQWLFARGTLPASALNGHGESLSPDQTIHAYQVVISASRMVKERGRQETVTAVVQELTSLWPEVGQARLLHWQLITEAAAVFSPLPSSEALRPGQRTSQPGLYLAGDWTQTGWPATMEGAVRSGFLAAEKVLGDRGQPGSLLAGDLPTSWLAKLLIAH